MATQEDAERWNRLDLESRLYPRNLFGLKHI